MKKTIALALLIVSMLALMAGCSSEWQNMAATSQSESGYALPSSSPISGDTVSVDPSLPSSSFLEDTSNQTSIPIAQNEEVIKLHALALADHLITRVISELPNHGELTERQIFDFILTLCLYPCTNTFTHPYADIVTIVDTQGLYAYYSESDVQKMVYEVFGIEDWSYMNNQHDLIQIDENGANEFVIAMEVGFATSPYSYENPVVQILDEQTVIVQFELFDTKLWPSSGIGYGTYQITLNIVADGKGVYLRYESCLAK